MRGNKNGIKVYSNIERASACAKPSPTAAIVDPTTTFTASSEDLVRIVTAGMEKKQLNSSFWNAETTKIRGRR